jgi:uncharacterized membrane protein YkvA (DUF1232 family)
MSLKTRRRMKNLLLFIPNLLLLSVRLLADRRVPKTEKALVAGAIVYAIIPFDLIPDMIPFVGQIDDAYLIAMTLLRLMDRTDPAILREHWSGGGDVVELLKATAGLAGKLLPKPIRRILSSRVVISANADRLIKALPQPLMVALPEREDRAPR